MHKGFRPHQRHVALDRVLFRTMDARVKKPVSGN